MNEKFKIWLEGCALVPGMLGGGLRLPDGSCVAHSFHEQWPQEGFAETLRGLGELLPLLSNHGLTPRWLTWTFAQGQIRLAERADGFLLGLVIRPNSPAAQNLDLVTRQFFSLDLTD